MEKRNARELGIAEKVSLVETDQHWAKPENFFPMFYLALNRGPISDLEKYRRVSRFENDMARQYDTQFTFFMRATTARTIEMKRRELSHWLQALFPVYGRANRLDSAIVNDESVIAGSIFRGGTGRSRA